MELGSKGFVGTASFGTPRAEEVRKFRSKPFESEPEQAMIQRGASPKEERVLGNFRKHPVTHRFRIGGDELPRDPKGPRGRELPIWKTGAGRMWR